MKSTIHKAPDTEDGEILSSPEMDAGVEITLHAEESLDGDKDEMEIETEKKGKSQKEHRKDFYRDVLMRRPAI